MAETNAKWERESLQKEFYDTLLCNETLSELASLVSKCRLASEEAQHASLKLTFQVVDLFLGGAMNALKKYKEFNAHNDDRLNEVLGSGHTKFDQESEEHTDWRPSAEPQVPLP